MSDRPATNQPPGTHQAIAGVFLIFCLDIYMDSPKQDVALDRASRVF